MTQPIEQHGAPAPKDRMDEGQPTEEAIDDILGMGLAGRSSEEPKAKSGEITNPDTQYAENAADRAATDPFETGPQETE